MSKCPGPLTIVCNYDAAPDTEGWTDARRLGCWNGDAASAPVGSTCARITSGGCWVNPTATSSVLFRCVPDYNISSQSATACIFPSNVALASDPRCVVSQTNTQGSTTQSAKPNLLFDQLNSARSLWGRLFGDLARAWWVILVCSIGVTVAFSFVYVQFVKYFTGCMVWTTVFGSILAQAALTGYFYFRGGLINPAQVQSLADQFNSIAAGATANATSGLTSTVSGIVPPSWTTGDDQEVQSFKIIAYVSTGVLVILLCIVASMFSSIRTAIEVIKIGCKALQAMPEMLLLPLTNIAAMAAFLVWWVFVAASLQSAGSISTTNLSEQVSQTLALMPQNNATAALTASFGNMTASMATIQDLPVLQYLQLYHVFGLLWTSNFITGVGTMTIAGSVCAWYFSQMPEQYKDDAEIQKLRYPARRCVACSAMWRTLRFYPGSVAFGALLIAIVQAVRLAFLYLQKQMEQAGKTSMLVRFIFGCIQCCLKCLQSVVEAVTTNAYIFTALKGKSFCTSGGMVFKLIVNHGKVFVAVNVLGTIIVFLGEVIIAVAAAAVAFIIIQNTAAFKPGGAQELSANWLPILVVLIFSYGVSTLFMGIFDTTVDSVLVCYCTDVDENKTRNGGKKEFEKSLHMEPSAFDAKAKADAKKAASEAKAAAKGAGTPSKAGAVAAEPATPVASGAAASVN